MKQLQHEQKIKYFQDTLKRYVIQYGLTKTIQYPRSHDYAVIMWDINKERMN